MWKNLLLSIITIWILLFALEGSSRILSRSLYVYDETLGYTLKPDTVHTHKSDVFNVRYRINKFGYRGKSYSKNKPLGKFRIVLIGDSHGFGWGINEDKNIFATIIDQRLAGVELINLSVPGYGTDQEFLRLKKEGLAYHPNLVILQISENDFTEIMNPVMYEKPKPFFILHNGKLLLKNIPVKKDCSSSAQYYLECLHIPFTDWLKRKSVAFNVIDRRHRKLMLRLGTYFKNSNAERSTKNKNITVIDDYSIKLFKAIISEMSNELKIMGIKIMIIHWNRYLSESGKINHTGIPVIDLYPAILKNKDKDVLIPNDGHININGHRLIAEELLKVLRKNKYISEAECSIL
ncbi:MAG: SGNH/GDSL hydrolase family protein [Nitrospiraceae bacterium]|nr:MAG: SGNH/GDSL hydrolase family protein [Nitrospiraceae bacterium]